MDNFDLGRPGGSEISSSDQAIAEKCVQKGAVDPQRVSSAVDAPRQKRDPACGLLEAADRAANMRDENGVPYWLSKHLEQWAMRVRSQAAKRPRGVSLTFEDLYQVVIRQECRCALSNIPFERRPDRGRNPFGVSVDRLDHGRGYHADNVRLVCVIVNIARNSFSDDDVVRMARAIAEKHAQSAEGYSGRFQGQSGGGGRAHA